MDLEGRRESENFEDRRGMSAGAKAGMGIGSLLLIGLITLLMGGNPMDVIQQTVECIVFVGTHMQGILQYPASTALSRLGIIQVAIQDEPPFAGTIVDSCHVSEVECWHLTDNGRRTIATEYQVIIVGAVLFKTKAEVFVERDNGQIVFVSFGSYPQLEGKRVVAGKLGGIACRIGLPAESASVVTTDAYRGELSLQVAVVAVSAALDEVQPHVGN